MQKYKHGLSESNMFLIKLYESAKGSLSHEDIDNDSLYLFVNDPMHFDYGLFDENWWPLFRFSDIGMVAVKYGRSSICDAFDRLSGAAREKAAYYVELYTEKVEQMDVSDIYHIPEGIENPMI